MSSSYGSSKDSQRFPQHLHCKVCGKAVPPNRELCSNECKVSSEKVSTRNKKMSRLYTFSFVVLMVLVLVFTFFRPP